MATRVRGWMTLPCAVAITTVGARPGPVTAYSDLVGRVELDQFIQGDKHAAARLAENVLPRAGIVVDLQVDDATLAAASGTRKTR